MSYYPKDEQSKAAKQIRFGNLSLLRRAFGGAAEGAALLTTYIEKINPEGKISMLDLQQAFVDLGKVRDDAIDSGIITDKQRAALNGATTLAYEASGNQNFLRALPDPNHLTLEELEF